MTFSDNDFIIQSRNWAVIRFNITAFFQHCRTACFPVISNCLIQSKNITNANMIKTLSAPRCLERTCIRDFRCEALTSVEPRIVISFSRCANTLSSPCARRNCSKAENWLRKGVNFIIVLRAAFCASRSQKCKKILTNWLNSYALGSYGRKSCT